MGTIMRPVTSPVGGRGATQTRVRMVAQPASVPAVRRFVDDALTSWGREDLVDDVGLSVTELATNATLYSQSPYFDVELSAREGSVRVAVVDGGAMPARSIAARVNGVPAPESATDFDVEGMTGRGLFIVSSLASLWGIDDLPQGTRVWAEFLADGSTSGGHPVVSSEFEPVPLTVDGGVVIRMLDCPPDLLLAHDEHLADVARDLRLFADSHADEGAAQSAERLVEVVRLSALSWDAARLVAAHALREGRDRVDIALAVGDPGDLPRKVQILQQVTRTADEMSRQGQLMTLPASPAIRRWREWVAAEMTEQASTGREPRRFDDFPA